MTGLQKLIAIAGLCLFLAAGMYAPREGQMRPRYDKRPSGQEYIWWATFADTRPLIFGCHSYLDYDHQVQRLNNMDTAQLGVEWCLVVVASVVLMAVARR